MKIACCPCLNVKITHIDKINDQHACLDLPASDFLQNKTIELCFIQSSTQSAAIRYEFNPLIALTNHHFSSKYTLYKCLNCNVYVYFHLKSDRSKIYFNSNDCLLLNDEKQAKSIENYSDLLKIVVHKRNTMQINKIEMDKNLLQLMSSMSETKSLITRLELLECTREEDEAQVNTFKTLVEDILNTCKFKSSSQESLESGYICDENSNSSSVLSSRKQVATSVENENNDDSNDVFSFDDDDQNTSSKSYYCDEINVSDDYDQVQSPLQMKTRSMAKSSIHSTHQHQFSSCSLPRDIPMNARLFNCLPVTIIDGNFDNDESNESTNANLNNNSLHLGHAIAQLASSIVQKDGTELFGDRPSRRIPINSISKSCCYD